jgi:hypothetical protein
MTSFGIVVISATLVIFSACVYLSKLKKLT